MRIARIAPTSRLTFTLILVLFLCTPVTALAPEIFSVEPPHGANDSSTEITIHGNNFQSTPRVALYGGGPTVTGQAVTPSPARSVFVLGNHAYVADEDSGLQVIDISDPENPTIVGSADTPDSAESVFVSGNYAYVAVGNSGLQVIDISDPENPTIVGSVATPGVAYNVHTSGNHAYVADEDSGLQVIDVSEPKNPTIVGSADTPGYAYGVFVSGYYAYVANSVSGLQVIDISDPENPTIVGSADTPGYARGVFVSGNHAYVADGAWASGLQVIGISDPENPTIVGSADTPDSAKSVFVSGNYAYVADWTSGLQVLRAFEPCVDITFIDSTTLTATVPAGLPVGTYNLNVTNPNPERAILYNAFTVTKGDSNGDFSYPGSGKTGCFIDTAAYGFRKVK